MMFADAYEKASNFTLPVITSIRFFDKSVECSLASFIILNQDGWIVTVAHIFDTFHAFMQHSNEIVLYNKQAKNIEQNVRLNAKQKRKKIGHLKRNPKWITHHSFWWGNDEAQLKDIRILHEGDLAIGRLEPFNPEAISTYPTLKSTSCLRHGTSLCRLGFPFHQINADFHEETNSFTLAPGTLPVPRFPIEGIYTRNVSVGKSQDGKYDIAFLETSSPGLRGQSGGPIFDVKGTIWGIQSRTSHFPLGFSPKVKRNNREVEEHQFLNVGWGVHPQLLTQFLSDNEIDFEISAY